MGRSTPEEVKTRRLRTAGLQGDMSDRSFGDTVPGWLGDTMLPRSEGQINAGVFLFRDMRTHMSPPGKTLSRN